MATKEINNVLEQLLPNLHDPLVVVAIVALGAFVVVFMALRVVAKTVDRR